MKGLLQIIVLGAILYGSYTHFFDDSKAKNEADNTHLVQTAEEYYDSGNLKSQCEVINNLKNGFCIFYDKNKNIERRAFYKNDKQEGEEVGFYKSGNVFYVRYFTNGKENGKSEYFNEDGTRLALMIYKDGLRKGETSLFYYDNEILAKILYEENKIKEAWCGIERTRSSVWTPAEINNFGNGPISIGKVPRKCF